MIKGVQFLGLGLSALLLVGCNSVEETEEEETKVEEVGEVEDDKNGDKVTEGGEVYGIAERVNESLSNKEVPLLIGDTLKLGEETVQVKGIELLDSLEGVDLPIKSTVGVEESGEDNQYLKVNIKYEIGEVGETTQTINSMLVVYGETEDGDEGNKQVHPKQLVGIGFEDREDVSEEDIYLKEGQTFEGYIIYDLEGTTSKGLVAQLNTIEGGEVIEFPLTDSEGNEIVRSEEEHGEVN